MAALLGIDVGTSACKLAAVNHNGELLQTASCEYPLLTPKPGWTEQNPEDWWNAVQKGIAKINMQFDAIGLSGQMHGSVFLNVKGEVIRPALLWNDQRTESEVEQMNALAKDELLKTTCNPPMTGFQAPKVLWLKKWEPEHYKEVRKVLLPKDYIRFRLTGEFATDVTDASGVGLFDVPNRRWSNALIERFELDPSLFPPAFESGEAAGRAGKAVAAAGAGDQAGAAVGIGAVSSSVVSMSLGTSGVVFSAQDSPSYDPGGRVHTFCHANRKWHAMSVMLSCGGALQWVVDRFGFQNFAEFDAFASRARLSTELFKPYLAGERSPHNDPNLRASFSGLGLSTGKPEIAFCTLLGVSFGLLEGYDALMTLRTAPCSAIRVNGGGSRSDFWMQTLADLFGVPTQRMSVDEGPAFGAALLAGVSAGVWSSVHDACEHAVRISQVFEPNARKHAWLRQEFERWKKQPPFC